MNKILKNKKRIFTYILTGTTILFITLFITGCYRIGNNVKKLCLEAKKNYDGDCTESLIGLLKDEDKDFGKRNSAIWALGQLGDKRALPVLQSYYTGEIPSKEPYYKVLSQYELKKAIILANGGLNITAIFWRYNINGR